MKLPMFLLVVLLCLLSGCEKKPLVPQPEIQPAPSASSGSSGREETKRLEAYDALGYDGKAIRGKVDQALDQNEKRAENVAQQINQAENPK